MSQDSIELYFDKESKSVFDRLIERIIKRIQTPCRQATIDFYENGQYVYKYADILRDLDKLYIVYVMDWSELRKFWLKIIELTRYLGTYKAYTEILQYMFGDAIRVTFSSRTTDEIEQKEEIRQAGNLWINISQASSIIEKMWWLTDSERRTMITWTAENPQMDFPIYLTRLLNLNIDIINEVINFLTPAGLRTYLNITI